MYDFLTNVDLFPFHLSLMVLFVVTMAETIGSYFNQRPSRLLAKIFPTKIFNSPFIQVNFSKSLIVIFLLLNFSIVGYFIQLFIFAKHQTFAPFYLIIPPTLVITVFFTVFMIHCLDQVIKPKTYKTDSNLVGRLATISSGNARPGFSAQARVRDDFGQLHYVQVEPEFGELEFQTQIIIVRQKKSHYIAKEIAISTNLLNN